MEKALSMFSEDFGGFMRPHSEPLAFPGKRSGPRGEGGRAGRDHPLPLRLQRQVLPLQPRAAAGADVAGQTDVARTGRPSGDSAGLGSALVPGSAGPGARSSLEF